MKAAWYERLGPAPEVLTVGEIPTPEPSPGEVLVRVTASGVNPSDVKKRAGWHGGALDFPRIVPHSDGAGTIEAVGSGVLPDRIGQRVWVYNAQWERPFGTAAEYVCLPNGQAVPLLDSVSFEAGACLGIPACTAHHAVTGDGPVEGKTVLVQGGAGAVGFYAVQVAALSGATVIATVSSPDKAGIARSGGAHHTVDYRADDVREAVLDITRGEGVDRIVEVDLGANIASDAAVLKRWGSVAAYSSTSRPKFEFDYYGFGYKGASLRFVQVYILTQAERRSAIDDLTRWMGSTQLKHKISETFPLDRIAEAHSRQESGGTIGNIVLTR